ncbi:MAG: DUF2281 domain-containing protein [Planctomycetaceae bacterium]|jgi:hypothetical protein|nr:DUF2281 domain-containing protein [Planctomycetaceae bacterium]
MSTATDSRDNSLLTRIAALPDSIKTEIADFIDKRLESELIIPQKPAHFRRSGWAKDKFTIIMHDDFDEPLDDFREYT